LAVVVLTRNSLPIGEPLGSLSMLVIETLAALRPL
jgi:hypothetical protein